jgi:hypothetical protein
MEHRAADCACGKRGQRLQGGTAGNFWHCRGVRQAVIEMLPIITAFTTLH